MPRLAFIPSFSLFSRTARESPACGCNPHGPRCGRAIPLTPLDTHTTKKTLVETYLSAGDQLLRDGLYQEAAQEYERQLGRHPTDLSSLIGAGRCWLALKEYETAAERFAEAQRQQPADTRVWTLLAESLMGLGRYDEAMALLTRVVASPDSTAHAHFLRGKLLTFDGQHTAAVDACRKALEIDPSYGPAADLLGEAVRQSIEVADEKERVMPDILKDVGFYHLRRDHKTLALGLFQQAAQFKVKDTQMYLTMGRHLGDEALYTQAFLAYEQAIQVKPDNHDLLAGMAIVAAAQGNLSMALDFINQAAIVAPLRADLQVYRGDLMVTAGQFEEALRSYQEAARLDRNDPQSHFALATTYSRLGFDEEALACYQKAILLNTSLSLGYLNLATIHERQGRFSEAHRYLKRFLELSPDDVRGSVWLLSILISQGRHRQALAAGEEMLKSFAGHPDILLNMGVAAMALEDDQRASGLFEKVLEQSPENAGALVNLGILAVHRQDVERARTLYERAIRKDPRCPEATYNLGLLEMRAGRLESSLCLFRAAVAEAPYFSEAFHNLGVCLSRLKREEEATAMFSRAIKTKSALPGSRLGLGQSLEQQERLDEALKAYEELIKTSESLEETRELLLSIWAIHRKRKSFDRAKKVLDGAAFMSPEAPDVHLAMGVTCHEANDLDAAKREYERTLSLDPDNLCAKANLAVYTFDVEKDAPKATSQIRAVLNVAPSMSEVEFNLGVMEALSDHPKEALEAFSLALLANPDMSEAYLARTQVRLGEDPRADLDDLTAAVQANPKSVVTWINLGTTQQSLGLLEDALESTERALLLDDSLQVAHFNRAVLLEDLGELETAEKGYLKAASLGDDADVQFNLGELYERMGRIAQAKVTYLALTRRYPKCWEAKVNLARICREEGSTEEALFHLSDAVALRPEDPIVLRNWAITLLSARDISRARDAVLRLVEVDPGPAESHLVRGAFHLVVAELDEAKRSLEKAVEIDPRSASARFCLAWTLLRQDQLDAVAPQLDELLVLAPNEPSTYLLQAAVLGLKGESDLQESSLKKARELDPTGARARLELAHLFIEEERYEEALLEFQALLPQIALKFPTRRGMGEATYRLGRFLEAAWHFAEATPPQGGTADVLFNRALALHEAGDEQGALTVLDQPNLTTHPEALTLMGRILTATDPARAIQALSSALHSKPGLFEARVNLAGILTDQRREEEALACLDHESLPPLAAVCFQRALIHDRLGDLDRALLEYRKAVRKGLPEAYLNIALIHRRRRDYTSELAELRRARDKGVAIHEVRLLEAQAHILRGRPAKALTCLAEAEPDDPLVAALTGSVHSLMGRGKEAVPWLEKALEEAPSDPDLIHNLAVACVWSREPDLVWERMVGMPPRNWVGDALVRACLTEIKQGTTHALQWLEESIERLDTRASGSEDRSGKAALWIALGNLALHGDPERCLLAYLKAIAALPGPPPPYLLANLGKTLLARSHPWATLRALSEMTGLSRRRLRMTFTARPIFDNRRLLHTLRSEYGPRFPASWLLPSPRAESC